MRHGVWTILPLLVTSLLAEGYSEADRRKAINELEEGHRLISVLLETCTVSQSSFKPDSKTWSILEILEHLALTEDLLFSTIQQTLENGKPTQERPQKEQQALDQLVLKTVADRSQKATAPERATPKGQYRNLDEARLAFGERRSKTIDWVRATQLPLRKYRAQSPVGELDVHQWLLLLAGHTKRHAQQIEELMRHPEYPTNR
ncbi:MAG: DinB family protein [Bryobacteraceae bacterium]|nr:DinB family protein [Bryobacteraceae bacterium]MDW8377168.1 DinB family protein [Bryobacterales bacterium]